MSKEGRIEVIIGPMFSGKTTEMFNRVQRYVCAGFNPLIITYSGDNRYNNNRNRKKRALATSHDQVTMSAISIDKDCLKSTCIPNIQNVQVIGIDEGQFFNNLSQFCDEMANRGKIVVVSGLLSTYQRTPFPEMVNLLAVSDIKTFLHGVCITCKGDSCFSKKISNLENKSQEDIGGAEKYVSTCRKCFYKNVPQSALDERKQAIDIIQELRRK